MLMEQSPFLKRVTILENSSFDLCPPSWFRRVMDSVGIIFDSHYVGEEEETSDEEESESESWAGYDSVVPDEYDFDGEMIIDDD